MGIVEAKCPVNFAGHQCATLGWLEGFRKLGWDIWIVEEMRSEQCTDAAGKICPPEESIHVAAWRRFAEQFGFVGRETLFIDGKSPRVGEFRDFARGADLFLNYSGQFHGLHHLDEVRSKAYLDVDPGYTQVWADGYDCDMNFDGHDHFVSVGVAMGSAACPVPTCGREWIPTPPPASVSFFSAMPPAGPGSPWTTVGHWYAGYEVHLDGEVMMRKRESFRQIEELPRLVRSPVVVACDMQPDWEDCAPFGDRGWQFRSVSEVCASMRDYRAFIGGSTGEIGVPKAGYVTTRAGWMSDRSMVYLASGRPVVAMDTGWKAVMGEFPGLRAFSNVEEAARCIREIEADYESACRSARHIAETIFADHLVVGRVLERMGIGPTAMTERASLSR